MKKQSSASRNDTQNTSLFDTNLAANANGKKDGNDRKDTLQSANETQETKTCEAIEEEVTRATFTQALGDDEKNDSYDYDDEMFHGGHRLIKAHSKDTIQLAKNQSSHDIETNTIAPNESLARKTDTHGTHNGDDRDRDSDGTSTKRNTVLAVTGYDTAKHCTKPTMLLKMHIMRYESDDSHHGIDGDYMLDKKNPGDHDLHITESGSKRKREQQHEIQVTMILIILCWCLIGFGRLWK